MELDDQIYVNVEKLHATCSPKQKGSEKTVSREETETQPSFKVASVCLGVLCFLLLTAVTWLSALYSRDVNQLSRDLANHTAERLQLLVRYQNLSDERDRLQASVKKADRKCPHGWKKFGCSCYSLSQERSTWQSSRQQCGGQGADLVIINSWREMLFLNRLGSHLKFWIGLSQSSSQTQWMWVDGSSLRTTYWQYRHPSAYSSSNCVAFNSFQGGYTARSWCSEHCGQYLQWVCEREAEMFDYGIL
ncbi:CD209 antigen-like protein E [Anabas testudineus]|uniref:CD209 antigen-like protein E n=1 Tax=Anabas testudineus TaxID=64144 RepID=UPI000E4585A9|nr:CD209 antigen-like protein E [Anabas testudineus]